MAPMRPHQKTRTGCKTCKQRKVKCDETLPICNNCTKRGVDCVWNDPDPTQESTMQGQIPLAEQSDSSDPLTLEIMHHYSISTSYTLCSDPDASEVWRTIIPQMAFKPQSQCLLNAILAISALHIYHMNSTSPQYASAASNYYNQAKIGIHNADDVDSTTDVNAVLVAMCIISRYEFASSAAIFPYPGDWYITLQETHINIAKNRTEYQGRVMHSLLEAMAPPHLPTCLKEPFPLALSTILNSPQDVEELRDASVRTSYQESIYLLQEAWRAPFNRCVGLWWYMMSNTFFRLLTEEKPRALIILAHYCVMMNHIAQTGPWWVQKKWGDEAARIVSMLDACWEPCLRWVSGQLNRGRDSQASDFTDRDFLTWLNDPSSVEPGNGSHSTFAPR
ncbi:uncharacterized protein EV420DRAFT_737289 [Desarmillaria tabescens]|uniref:Zn(2)-C6 fungal-type domain-containing protein n=1 Tax=Armillaria tabescens TaxID=1929756 RepID=A0AA39JXP0_ARMTA|nr:uncharacterized protein EV420DRAFT_737289 [Desarmillaria tabescens]KAK0450492.1 hypothetical protein EV420DRAFT_737289 [Desarmillaria tabescens]